MHCGASEAYFCDHMDDWQLWLSAQCHKRHSYHIIIDWERIKIQSMNSTEYVCFHSIVKWKPHKPSLRRSKKIYVCTNTRVCVHTHTIFKYEGTFWQLNWKVHEWFFYHSWHMLILEKSQHVQITSDLGKSSSMTNIVLLNFSDPFLGRIVWRQKHRPGRLDRGDDRLLSSLYFWDQHCIYWNNF
jgi:hypothetical protein